MFQKLCFLVLFAGAFAFEGYEECKKGGVFPDYIDLNLCDVPPCQIFEGDDLIVHARLHIPYATAYLNTSLDYIFGGITAAFPIPEEVKRTCDYLTPRGACPLQGLERVDYDLQMAGLAGPLDGVKVTTEFAIKDDKGDNMFCVRFAAIVYKRPRPTDPPKMRKWIGMSP